MDTDTKQLTVVEAMNAHEGRIADDSKLKEFRSLVSALVATLVADERIQALITSGMYAMTIAQEPAKAFENVVAQALARGILIGREIGNAEAIPEEAMAAYEARKVALAERGEDPNREDAGFGAAPVNPLETLSKMLGLEGSLDELPDFGDPGPCDDPECEACHPKTTGDDDEKDS